MKGKGHHKPSSYTDGPQDHCPNGVRHRYDLQLKGRGDIITPNRKECHAENSIDDNVDHGLRNASRAEQDEVN